MNEFVTLIIWVVVIGVAFGILWRKGILMRISNYTLETREELRKCSWPSWEELKGSTAVVLVTIALMGAFTLGVDFVLALVMRVLTSLPS